MTRKSSSLPHTLTSADLTGQALVDAFAKSPYRDIDLEPARHRSAHGEPVEFNGQESERLRELLNGLGSHRRCR